MRLSVIRMFRLGHFKGYHPNSVSAIDLPEPKVVSPLIRFCRWSALIAGVGWGIWRKYRWDHWHKGQREIRHLEQEEDELLHSRAAYVKGREDLILLLKQGGIPLTYENRKSFHILDPPYAGKEAILD